MTRPPTHRRALDVRSWLIGLLASLVALACIVIVVVGQMTVGWPSLIAMLAATAGLITLLALYNRRSR
ncbi:DUF6903 family protein [Microbacterium maritypicum]|uniref:DUF6903 family protein n=1 Tax=Microbacterium maritypicum TaxID=33918 RepID=UPI003800A3BC